MVGEKGRGGFQWQRVKSKHFPTVFKQIEKNKKKSDETTGIFTQNQFSTKSIFFYGCDSKISHTTTGIFNFSNLKNSALSFPYNFLHIAILVIEKTRYIIIGKIICKLEFKIFTRLRFETFYVVVGWNKVGISAYVILSLNDTPHPYLERFVRRQSSPLSANEFLALDLAVTWYSLISYTSFAFPSFNCISFLRNKYMPYICGTLTISIQSIPSLKRKLNLVGTLGGQKLKIFNIF
ncbi:hypothetical protein AGLY_016039 [Aphis glycines]|uniref:Uncharacterized protein n=1 Tax=Aphis glycines TaxID=307491 RepID=A0A6G0T0Q7_APHGL|nr:hypothetical protein AGLY_016039 [Aphis glycines]